MNIAHFYSEIWRTKQGLFFDHVRDGTLEAHTLYQIYVHPTTMQYLLPRWSHETAHLIEAEPDVRELMCPHWGRNNYIDVRINPKAYKFGEAPTATSATREMRVLAIQKRLYELQGKSSWSTVTGTWADVGANEIDFETARQAWNEGYDMTFEEMHERLLTNQAIILEQRAQR